MTGKVYKSTGSWYVVKTAEGEIWSARLKGIMKLDGITSTNPIAVGDDVEMERENEDEKTAIITEIHDRRNYINRQSPSHRMQHHIVAANLDQSLLLVTLKDPRTSQGFIDRWLLTCEAYHVPAILLFNKVDIYRKKDEEKFALWKDMYESIGYRVVRMSVETGEGVEDVKALLHGKISLLSGHSGVGKSSFLNAIFPALRLKTHGVSGWSGKGIHTTTFAEMFDLPVGGEGARHHVGGVGQDSPGDEPMPDKRAMADGRILEKEDLQDNRQLLSEEATDNDGVLASENAPVDRHAWSSGGQIIDTPGMREFGIVDISRQELSGYFPEMRVLAGQCQFNNCLHMEEPGCAVKDAVQKELIAMDRYVSYCSILDSIEENKY